MEVFTAFAGELESSIAWGSGGFTTLGGAVARLQRGERCSPASVSTERGLADIPGLSIDLRHLYHRRTCLYEWRRGRHLYRHRWWR